MNEYISKEFMLKNLEDDKMNNAEHCEPVTIQIMERFIRYVKEFPAADVQPVKHGRWINENFCTRCSACGNMTIYDKYSREVESDYCPNCGAKMDGDRDD